VYVLEPSRLNEKLKQPPDRKIVEADWKSYVAKHPSYDLSEDEWEYAYLPEPVGLGSPEANLRSSRKPLDRIEIIHLPLPAATKNGRQHRLHRLNHCRGRLVSMRWR